MKSIILVLFLAILTQYEMHAQNEFELDPNQSMLMTGKGAGQEKGLDLLSATLSIGGRS